MTVELRFMPCAEFELSIHGYVDQEASPADANALLVHLELCDDCRAAVEMLRRQIRAHRDAVDFGKIADAFDQKAFFKSLTGSLMMSNLERLAALLYDLGKAYYLVGNDSKILTYVQKKAVSIERAKAEGRRLAHETSKLIEQGETETSANRTRASVRRADQLFRGRRGGRSARIGARSGRGALDNARRFLEECLILDSTHAEARHYLALYFTRIGRNEEAMAEYRKLIAQPDLKPLNRVMAMQALACCHGDRLEYDKAVEILDQIVQEGLIPDRDMRFFPVWLSLAMFQAKLLRFDRSTETFGELIARYPNRVDEARRVLDRADVFRALLRRESEFHSGLVRRYPMLFAG